MLHYANPPDLKDPARLCEHLHQCAHAHGRLHRLHCLVDAVADFVAPRLVTSMAVLTVLLIASSHLLN